MIIRRATPHDAAAVARLAQLDSSPVPAGDLLVAEVGGELRAALRIDDYAYVADPFHRSREVVALLAERADGIRKTRPVSIRLRARLGLWSALLNRATRVHPTA